MKGKDTQCLIFGTQITFDNIQFEKKDLLTMNNLVILLAGMKADLMLHHNVVHMQSLQNTLAREESYLDALDLIQGGQESKVDDDPIGMLDGTILNDSHPHLKELSIRPLNNPAETKHLKKISEQKIKELKFKPDLEGFMPMADFTCPSGKNYYNSVCKSVAVCCRSDNPS